MVRQTKKSVGRSGACRSSSLDRAVKPVRAQESLHQLMYADQPIPDRIKVRRAMESSLQKTAMKIVAIVDHDKDHIPPITTSDQNPFPYRIFVNPKQQESAERGFGGWN